MSTASVKAPNTILIISCLIVFTAIMTWIVPGGQYDRVVIDGRERVEPDSFSSIDSDPQSIFDILTAPIKGFVDAALIIGFVLIVGGSFGILQQTGAIEVAIRGIARAHTRHRMVRILLIPIFMIIFSLAGSVFGMSEEVIPFVLIFVPMALALGYDSIVGVAIPFVGAGAGFAGAFLNPFTIGIAQGIAGLRLFSGLEYRMIAWVVTTTVAILFVIRYAAKVKTTPEASPTFTMDEEKRKHIRIDLDGESLDLRHRFVLFTFGLAMGILVFGVLKYKWYIEEIAALFLGAGVLIGAVGGLKPDAITDAFLRGAKDLMSTAIIIGLARAILIVARQGRIIDTMLHALSSVIGVVHPIVSSQLMFIVQTLINFFVPSGSGQAALTMPVMAPLSDLVGVSRQTAVLAYQFGDGFSNMIIPTSAVTIGVLTLANIPWEQWAKWILPLEIIFVIVGCLLLIPPYFMQW